MAQRPTDDPFAGLHSNRTFVKPSPGGLSGTRSATLENQQTQDTSDTHAVDHGLSPLLAVANRLLVLAPQLRQTRQVHDMGKLRSALALGIREFESHAQNLGIAPKRVMAARYVMCTMLDESANDTPWGGSGAWAHHSLLAEFHYETSGGEKVFQLMARLAENPDVNRDLLELIYAAVSLGFEGRYRALPNGRAQLEAVRAKLAQLIRQQRGPYAPALAQHWVVPPVAQRRALSWLPLALTAALSLLLLGGAYAAYSITLANLASPVYGRIQALRLAPPLAAVAQLAAQPRLAMALQSDVRADLVVVRDEVDRSVVTLRGDALFAPASATLAFEHEALLRRVSAALVRVGGDVLVTGHTDNTPIRSLRFPSNWHLSEERARAVRQLLIAAGVPADRVRAEGRADGEPLAANDTAAGRATNDSPAGRAANRRVEIMLMAPMTPGTATVRPPSTAAAASR